MTLFLLLFLKLKVTHFFEVCGDETSYDQLYFNVKWNFTSEPNGEGGGGDGSGDGGGANGDDGDSERRRKRRRDLCGENYIHVDRFFLVAMPLLFLVFNIIYWTSYGRHFFAATQADKPETY